MDDDDSEEEEDIRPMAGEVIVQEDERQAIDAVQRRHAQNREFMNRDAAAIAEEYRRKAMDDRQHRFGNTFFEQQTMAGGRVGSVLQQSLLPSVSDPCIWRFKVSTGKEQLLVQTIMRKAVDSKLKGGPLRIKSAFCGSSKGYVYVEGIAEPLAREAVVGLRGIYQRTMKLVPVQEMTAVLNVATTKTPMTVNQWARVSRGPLKGDLVRIVVIYEGGNKVMIQAVPRPDYSAGVSAASNAAGKKANVAAGLKARPPQRLFEVSEVIKAGGESFRKFHPDDRSGYYEFWNNEYYKDGYLYKAVNPETFLHLTNVKPRVEEQKLFLNAKSKTNKDGMYGDDDDAQEDDDDENDIKKSQSLLTDLAQDLHGANAEDNGTKTKACPFVVGDLVQVASGELRNLVARVVFVNELDKSVRVIPVSRSGLTGEFTIEIGLLVKYVEPNEHVKVVQGQHMGQTGRVVSVNVVEGRPVAAILTDGINSEIQVDVANLQVSNEVTTGLGSLMGFELYDLVAINDNECAVVIFVGAEKLTVKNHMDQVKDCYPQELQGKRNSQSTRSTGFDKNQITVAVGDVVNVVDGLYAKKSGTIKHIMKGTLWLHSNSILKHAGIFAVRARSCVVAGQKKMSTLGSMTSGSTYASTLGVASHSAGNVGTKVSSMNRPNPKAARDTSIGLTIRITQGQYKGLLAQVVDATGDTYTVELLAKLKKFTIDKSKTAQVGDKGGSLDPRKRATAGNMNDMLRDPNFLLGETPQHFGMHDTPRRSYGEATPSSATPSSSYGTNSYYGEATPMGGQATPSGSRDSVWHVTDKDVERRNSSTGKNNNSNYDTSSNQQPQYNWSNDSSSGSFRDPYNRGSGNNASAGQYGTGSFGGNSYGNGSVADNWGSPASQGGFGQNKFGESQISPASSMSSYSPYGQQPSPVGPVVSSNRSGNELPAKDWVTNMLVTFKQGPNVGRVGIVTRPPDEVRLCCVFLIAAHRLFFIFVFF
jgi:transcription elongation factor SPT5